MNLAINSRRIIFSLSFLVMREDQPFTAIWHSMQYFIFYVYPQNPSEVTHM
jgi:hypothetical protein